MSRNAGRIGWFLVWAVVFCDIGTSVYYVPGLLYANTGDRAGFFVAATMAAFVLMCVKEVEVTRRFPSGGGVVSLAHEAFGPWWGCLGGQLILVDFFLTVAISATSGVYYIDSILHLGGAIVPTVLACLALLCGLNIVGIKESASASLALACAAMVVDTAVIGATLLHAPPSFYARFLDEARALSALQPVDALKGYAGAWLAFSGLESMSQLAPAMRDTNETPRRGMIAVALTVLFIAPTLTFFSTFSLDAAVKAAESERFISELAHVWGGHGLKLAVVLTASALLMFAANTAIIGAYHVQLALQRRDFLPESLGTLSQRYQTPYRAIILCTLVPAAVILAVNGDMLLLGDLYAFGLLGAFVLSSTGIDLLRWKEGQRGIGFWLGALTSVAVSVAFVVNLFAKPLATAFGGTVTVIGLIVAHGTSTGWIQRALEKIPGMVPPPTPESTEWTFLGVDQARNLPREDVPGVLVASRGANRKIFQEAADRARARGAKRVYLVYIDEVPGLLFPQLARPTPEGTTVLEAGCAVIRELGMEPIPVWGLSHSAAGAVADAADACGCDTVVIGATQRTLIWQALRGRFIQEARRQLPPEIRLVVVG